jgi:hypothetical protein
VFPTSVSLSNETTEGEIGGLLFKLDVFTVLRERYRTALSRRKGESPGYVTQVKLDGKFIRAKRRSSLMNLRIWFEASL